MTVATVHALGGSAAAPTTSSQIWRKSRGFTLIEVILVLVLMGMTTVLALPFLRGGLDSLASAAAGRRLVSFLSDARSRSMNTGAPVEVVCDFEGRAFIQRLRGGEKARLTLPDGVRLVEVEAGGETAGEGEPALTFHPLGDSSGGSILIEDDRGRRFRVTVGVLFAAPVLTSVAD